LATALLSSCVCGLALLLTTFGRANLDTSSQHLLELSFISGLLLLLGLGKVFALLLELLDTLLLLLLLQSSGLLTLLFFLSSKAILLLGLSLGLGFSFSGFLSLTLELLLLLLKLGEMGRELLLLSSSGFGLGGGLNGSSLFLLLGGSSLGRLGLRGSTTLLLGGGLVKSC
jgi:hypothetical protein